MFCKEEDEKERQSSFLSLFMKVDRHFMTKCFGQMQELGLYPGQIPVLGLVSGRDGLSQREIAKILHIKPPTVNVSIQRLEKAGFLYKKPDEKDQRVTRIYMTEKGKEIKAKALERIHKNEAVMMEGFSEAEQCLLRRFLEQILANIEKIQPVMFENKKDISKETALAVAKKFLGDKGRNLVYETESANNILPSYSFVGQNDNGNVINIAITKKGGFPVYFTENRETGEEKLELSEAVQKAREFLYSRGYVSLKESYYEKGNGVATVNFAYEQGGVICYSDLIKVKVALDNGEILGTEMHGYIMNHKYRDFPTAALSENDARGKINSHLNVEKSNMALIPKDGETEKLCYEFTGTHNGRHFIIYINAENGCEEEILMLIESENGVLTM